MTSTTKSNPLDRLEQLNGQRTARTQALWDATQALCARLDDCTESGDRASCDAGRLIRRRITTNVATSSFWCWETREVDDCGEIYWQSVVLDGRGVGESWFLHGDFHCEMQSATRKDLLVFAGVAKTLVSQLCTRMQQQTAQLDTGVEQISKAL